ncbi:hypothetical protein EON81_08555 [bacterium]|nr:MAG: hypothetical protein EON81_08555 [bacterium]
MNAKSRVVFVIRSGPRKGRADLEAAFTTRQDAVRFAADLHGLEPSEAKTFAKSGEIELDRARHGSNFCALKEERMAPERAEKALSGELYLAIAPALISSKRRSVRVSA